MKELETAKEIFLTDVDDETRAENEAEIRAWESSLRANETYERWRGLELTQRLNTVVKQAYIDHSMALAENRALTEEQRVSIFAKKDACLFILSLTAKDAKSEMESVLREIRQKLNATNP